MLISSRRLPEAGFGGKWGQDGEEAALIALSADKEHPWMHICQAQDGAAGRGTGKAGGWL